MSTEVTPESLRAHATWLNDRGAKESHMALTRWADDLERESKPLPTVPGWYPNIVVERGEESFTGALLMDFEQWATARPVLGCYYHGARAMSVHIRWAEQDGKTPGQTVWEAEPNRGVAWSSVGQTVKALYERIAAAVLAAHGTPTLTDEECSEAYSQGWAAGHKAVKPASLVLTPVGEHPKPGTRGLLPVRFVGEWGWMDVDTGRQVRLLGPYQHTIVTDSRPEVE